MNSHVLTSLAHAAMWQVVWLHASPAFKAERWREARHVVGLAGQSLQARLGGREEGSACYCVLTPVPKQGCVAVCLQDQASLDPECTWLNQLAPRCPRHQQPKARLGVRALGFEFACPWFLRVKHGKWPGAARPEIHLQVCNIEAKVGHWVG